jgi:hypothetical protein
MKLVGLLSLVVALLIVASVDVCAAEWRGIVPLHSTRSDIVRLLNACEETQERCSFSLEDQDVQIVFSGWQHAFSSCPTNIPEDTVLLVRVRLANPKTVKELKLNLESFKAFDPSYPSGVGYRAYIDEQSGLLLRSYKGQVTEFDYIPTRRDQKLCPRFYENVRDFVRVVQRYGLPAIVVSCMQDKSGARFVVNADEDYGSLAWTVSEGAIVSGQGTREILVDVSGLPGRKITATVEVKIEDDQHAYSASCELQLPEKPK